MAKGKAGKAGRNKGGRIKDEWGGMNGKCSRNRGQNGISEREKME